MTPNAYRLIRGRRGYQYACAVPYFAVRYGKVGYVIEISAGHDRFSRVKRFYYRWQE